MTRITRPDVIGVLDRVAALRDESRDAFLADPRNHNFDLDSLWKKVMDGNAGWRRGENVAGLLTPDEQKYLAGLHRFAVEYRADHLADLNPIPDDVTIRPVDAGGVPAEWQIPAGADESRTILYFHGGGYIMGSPHFMRSLTVKLGFFTGRRVLSVDYRLAPEHPYPAGVDDCVATYRWLLESGVDPRDIVIAGDSAGGYFTLQTLIRARRQDLELPACAICLSPATDLALTGPSYITNAPTDPVLADLGVYWWVEAHLAGADPYDQDVSPLYADLHGLPPILIHASTTEMLLDDARMFRRNATDMGVDVTVQTWEDTVHVFHQFDLPEAVDAVQRIGEFIARFVK
jgi:acetyl esterase/lipase